MRATRLRLPHLQVVDGRLLVHLVQFRVPDELIGPGESLGCALGKGQDSPAVGGHLLNAGLSEEVGNLGEQVLRLVFCPAQLGQQLLVVRVEQRVPGEDDAPSEQDKRKLLRPYACARRKLKYVPLKTKLLEYPEDLSHLGKPACILFWSKAVATCTIEPLIVLGRT